MSVGGKPPVETALWSVPVHWRRIEGTHNRRRAEIELRLEARNRPVSLTRPVPKVSTCTLTGRAWPMAYDSSTSHSSTSPARHHTFLAAWRAA